MPFRHVFYDVLTANTDGVVLQAEKGGMYRLFSFGTRPERKAIGELKKGEQIWGHLTPAYEDDPPSRWEETSLEAANIFVLSLPKGDMLHDLEEHTEIIVRSDLVDLSYRVRDDPDVRERFPHLFSG